MFGAGAYYNGTAWVHYNTFNTSSAVMAFYVGGGGVFWYDSNNSSATWNVASGVQLWTDTGVLVGASSRDVKENFEKLDKDALLAHIDELEISRWNYKTDKKHTHIGPISEEFVERFKTGDDDKHIAMIDESGVALAAIQALSAEIKALKKDNEALRAQVDAMSKRLGKP
jgi:hypothetical protein